MSVARPRALHRTDIDWSRLYREGFRLDLGPGKVREASVFVVPLSERDDLVVLLAPVERDAVGVIRLALERAARLAQDARGAWTWLRALVETGGPR